MKKTQRGFTLIELMITVAIVAILTAIALPAYNSYVLRGKLTEAFTTLADYRVRLEQYYQDNRNYGAVATVCGVVRTATATDKFTYTCTAAGTNNQTYTMTATGVASQGTNGFVYTINQSNAKVTTGVPTGWTSNTACWVTKPGGTC